MTKEIAVKDTEKMEMEVFFPHNPDSSCLTVACGVADYAASHIARAVEDADARLLNLNVTSAAANSGRVVVALRVGHRDPERVARSLERYGYTVLGVRADEADDLTLRRRYDELMRYLQL